MFVVVEVRLAATGNRDLTLTDPRCSPPTAAPTTRYDSGLLKAVSGFRYAATTPSSRSTRPTLDDLTLELWEGEIVSGYQQRAGSTSGITPANADQWRAAGGTRIVEPRRHRGRRRLLP